MFDRLWHTGRRIGSSKDRLMFQSLIEQAHSIIQRLHASAELGVDTSSRGIQEYGQASLKRGTPPRMRSLPCCLARTQPPGCAGARWPSDVACWSARPGRRDIKRGDYYGLIDYFHLAIGALREFEASYQHRRAAPGGGSHSQHHTGAAAGAAPHLSPPVSPASRPEPVSLVRTTDDGWELTLALSDEAYDWLRGVVAAREPARTGDSAAIVELAATIIERVARNSQRDTRGR